MALRRLVQILTMRKEAERQNQVIIPAQTNLSFFDILSTLWKLIPSNTQIHILLLTDLFSI